MPMGQNAEGEWVDFAHSCPKCKRHLPLPEYTEKHCPNCGEFQRDPMKPPEDYVAAVPKVCPNCSATCLPNDKFCTSCGEKLK